MPFVYTVAGLLASTNYSTHASITTEDPTLSMRQATRGFDMQAAYCNGRAAAQTTITGISYVGRRWTTANGVSSNPITPAPKRIGTTALTTACDKGTGAGSLTAGTVSGAVQFAMGCGKAGPGGWVARDGDSSVHLEAGGADELCIASLSGEASVPHYVWAEIAE